MVPIMTESYRGYPIIFEEGSCKQVAIVTTEKKSKADEQARKIVLAYNHYDELVFALETLLDSYLFAQDAEQNELAIKTAREVLAKVGGAL